MLDNSEKQKEELNEEWDEEVEKTLEPQDSDDFLKDMFFDERKEDSKEEEIFIPEET